jgi:hypothetical protein
MLYWKYSPNRIFFLNEYWIFVPVVLVGNYVIIRKIRLGREKMKQLENLRKQIEREQKIRRILLLALGLNGCIYLSMRGGELEFLNVEYIRDRCNIEKGVRYLDNNRLRNIIHDLYKHKRKGKIIYITATAICHLANRYGQTFLDLPFAVGDFGLTSVFQTFRKALVTMLLGGVGPLVVMGGPFAFTVALILGTSGLRLAFTNLDFIPTSPVDVMVSAKNLKPRIPDRSDVVILNNRDKITISQPVQENQECWLADQRLLNQKCNVESTKIPDAIDLVSADLKYDETVNMQDITGLNRVEFSDKFDIGQTKSSIYNSPKGKEVNFIDKFGDSEIVDSSASWDTNENEFIVPEKRYLRTRNKA